MNFLGKFLIERSISTSLMSFIPVRGEAGESLAAKNIQESRKSFYFTRTCLTVCHATRLYVTRHNCMPRNRTVCQATRLYAMCYSGAMCQIAGARTYQVAWLYWAAATGKPHSHLNPTSSVNAAFFASTDVFDQFPFIHYHRPLFSQYLA